MTLVDTNASSTEDDVVVIPQFLTTPDQALSRKWDLSTPEGWRDKLVADLAARQLGLQFLEDYYEGRHKLAFATEKFKTTFGLTFRAFADNWCPIVVDAVGERLRVEGFRFGSAATGGDVVTGDGAAWEIWQANQLDAYSRIAHTEALIAGESYALVAPAKDGLPEVTIETASQMIVAWAPGSQRKRLAALKRWCEDDGTHMATLYMPNDVFKWEAKPTSGTPEWVARKPVGESWPMKNTFGVVPVVPLVNRPRLRGGGRSELADVIPIQDAINKTVMDMLVSSEFGSFKQRWVTGMEIPTDPTTGQQVEPFEKAIGRTFMSEDPETRFGEFTQTDLGNYVQAIEMLVQHIASQSRTPPHYFYLKGQFPSGESIKSAETGLVAKARDRMTFFGEAWEEVMRLCFKATGDTERASFIGAEVIWGDPESRTESEHVDAIVKKKALNIPDEILWEQMGMTPTEIERVKTIRQAERDAQRQSEMTYEETRNRSTAAAALVNAGFDPAAVLAETGLPAIPYTGKPSAPAAPGG